VSIIFNKVSYLYNQNTSMEQAGLSDVSFELHAGSFTAVVGHTGSGKSTLLQHFNALLKPTSGTVEIAGFKIDAETSNKGLKPLRQQVGIVFQFPESQLFEETVEKDIAFGPQNFGLSEAEAHKRARTWLHRVGLSKDLANRSPFDLSGGQMRRVAIAGIMASEPAVLCLDEPAAGLDPQGHQQIMQLFKKYQAAGHTVVLITHDMDDAARYADDVLVMDHGHLVKHASPAEVFKDKSWLAKHHLQQPATVAFSQQLAANGMQFDQLPLTKADLVKAICQQVKGADQ
jgi:energy-coupling factor transport system ATP-binding protein